MINKRLIFEMKESMRFVYQSVGVQWIMLVMNIFAMTVISEMLESIFLSTTSKERLLIEMMMLLLILVVRYFLSKKNVMLGYEASKNVKMKLREKVLNKLNEVGAGYVEYVSTSSLVQVCIEGIDQLEIYFGSYLAAFFYSLLAPLTLFIVLSFVSLKAAMLLLICVPIIPLTIIFVSKIAKKRLSHYWDEYMTLGNSFLENLEGLTTLKIYGADELKHQQMNEEAERFRKITMKVLTMQLNSITVMDLVAFGGAAFGMIVALLEFQSGHVSMAGCLLIFLLSADFFIPMRSLGSLFHVAMNGVAASDRLFAFLDIELEKKEKSLLFEMGEIKIQDVTFSYDKTTPALENFSLTLYPHQLVSVVGESGCGKSTLISLLMKQFDVLSGSILLNDIPIEVISREEWMEHVTCLSTNSKLFKGSVADNLLIAKKDASDEEMWDVLKKVHLDEIFKEKEGLDTLLQENGRNLSGGQCQRLAFARALLHDSEIYFFDEATSNIDVESENDLMALIYELAKTKTVVMITHRLANAKNSDVIVVMEKAHLTGFGTHDELMKKNQVYQNLYNSQMELERGE